MQLLAPLTAASLTGPDGPVEIRAVAADDPEVGRYMPPGAMLIPVRPLAAAMRYTARVTFRVGGAPGSRTWSFTTAADGAGSAPALSIASTWPRTVVGRVARGRVSCTRACRFSARLYVKGRKEAVATTKGKLGRKGSAKPRLRLPRSLGRSTRRAKVIVRATDVATGRAASPLANRITFIS